LTNKHGSTESFAINADSTHIERTLIYKCLALFIAEKLTWKQLYCTVSKYVGGMHKVKAYVNNQALHTLRQSLANLINSQAWYENISWERAASCHLQPTLVVSNCTIK